MRPFVVFIPGLFGSSLLKCNEVVWPVTNLDKFKISINNVIGKPIKTIFTSDKHEDQLCPTIKMLLSKLGDKNLTPGALTDNYDKIISLIRDVSEGNFFIFNYDWRNSLNDVTDEFARAFAKLEVGSKDIVIIGHSAGGVIAHKYIGSPEKYNIDNPNYIKIKKFIAIGTPFQGSMKALTAILGLLPQNLLSGPEIKEILSTEFFKSIYELCPYNIHNYFYHKDSRNHLTSKQIIEILKKNGFPNRELKNYLEFKDEMKSLTMNENVNYLIISGTYNKPMCGSFLADIETGNLECIYDYGGGDGTVLKDENTPFDDFSYRKISVLGKHVYLTEIDEVLQIISDELKMETTKNIILFSDIISTANKQIEFNLYFLKNKVKHYISDFTAEHVSFSLKTVTSDLTKKINKKIPKKGANDPVIFYFKTKEEYGFLRFKNLNFSYRDSQGNLQSEFMKYAKVELEKQTDIFF